MSTPEQQMKDRMIKWFGAGHAREDVHEVALTFQDFALKLCDTIEAGPERTVALRKLLEARDAAVRAKLHPEG